MGFTHPQLQYSAARHDTNTSATRRIKNVIFAIFIFIGLIFARFYLTKVAKCFHIQSKITGKYFSNNKKTLKKAEKQALP